ncbi:hypothetical protein QWW67_25435 [Rhodococcus sp. M8-50]|uniref:hypothetical protein n=2 Tax=Rhodococcus TaxID=1827 RepID=UPI00092A1485|nr:hypothetical protein [Rhodococcus sp. M8]OLL21263.1 hypothetical protein BKE56_015765 [Rhodococcus sp. M8]
MEALGGLSAADLGASSLLAIAVALIMFGGLVPRWLYRSALEEKDKQINEKSLENLALRDLTAEQSQQVTTLIQKVELSLHIAEVVKKLGEEAGT